jgi:pSer/pThr/pTyr-binding forkhead associated (FHA) protein
VQLLIIREHGSPDRVFDLFGEDVVIGRSRSCDLRLANVSVSREHAVFRWEAGEYLVEDKGSHNGVYVNGTRVDAQRLGTGDLVRLGKYELVYVHEKVPRVLQSADIEAMPRWHQVTIGTADDSTFRISESMMERMIAARRLLESGRIVQDGEGHQDWTPGEETLGLGRGATIPLDGLFMGAHVAEILWNGRSHVFKRISRRLKVKINGRTYTDATMLEHGDTIDVGKTRLRYVVG